MIRSFIIEDIWKWKWSRSVVSNSLWPHGLQPARLLHLCDFLGKNTGVSSQPLPSPGDLPHPGIKHPSPALQVDSLLSEPPGKPLHLPYDPVIPLPGIYPREIKTMFKNLYMNVYSNVIHSHQKRVTNQIFYSWWTNQQTEVHLYNKYLQWNKKESTNKHMDKS